MLSKTYLCLIISVAVFQKAQLIIHVSCRSKQKERSSLTWVNIFSFIQALTLQSSKADKKETEEEKKNRLSLLSSAHNKYPNTYYKRLSVTCSVVSKSLRPQTPWTVAPQVPLSIRFSRQEQWSGQPFPSPGDLLNPGIELWSARQAHSFHLSHQGSRTRGTKQLSLPIGIFGDNQASTT